MRHVCHADPEHQHALSLAFGRGVVTGAACRQNVHCQQWLITSGLVASSLSPSVHHPAGLAGAQWALALLAPGRLALLASLIRLNDVIAQPPPGVTSKAHCEPLRWRVPAGQSSPKTSDVRSS